MFTGKSIICFGGEDWWYHHPHSKNHLMRRFARAGNKVIFVNSISMGLAPMKSGEVWPRIKRKLKSYAKLARMTEEGITVVSPAVVPWFGSRAAAATNRRLLTAQISRLAKKRAMGTGERRGGEEGRTPWAPDHLQKKRQSTPGRRTCNAARACTRPAQSSTGPV